MGIAQSSNPVGIAATNAASITPVPKAEEETLHPSKRKQKLRQGEYLDEMVVIRVTEKEKKQLLTDLASYQKTHPSLKLSDLIRDQYFKRGAFTIRMSKKKKGNNVVVAVAPVGVAPGVTDHELLWQLMDELADLTRKLGGYLNNFNQLVRKMNSLSGEDAAGHEQVINSIGNLNQPTSKLLVKVEKTVNQIAELLA
ncbi:MAG: hypothetical protein LH609_08505 [Rudanella sp.]|nr:hypothetical protein [Rudanella sp.]